MPTLHSIQHLRALAALSVVLYHAGQWAGWDVEPLQFGVDVFFVISGFVMQATTEGRAVSPGSFLWRRFTRIAPLYWVATLALVGLAVVAPQLAPAVSWTPERLLKSLAFIPHLNADGLPFPVLALGWTLNYEATFYLLFAAALLAPQRLRLPVVAALLIAPSLVWGERDPLFRTLDPYLLEFLAGVLIARAWRAKRLRSGSAGAVMIVAGLGIVVFVDLIFSSYLGWRPVLWGPPAALIVAGAVAVERAEAWPRLGLLRRLGDASYALYLTHPIVLSVVAAGAWLWGSWLMLPVGAAASILVAFVVRVAVEKPLLAALRGERRPDRAPPAAPAREAA